MKKLGHGACKGACSNYGHLSEGKPSPYTTAPSSGDLQIRVYYDLGENFTCENRGFLFVLPDFFKLVFGCN